MTRRLWQDSEVEYLRNSASESFLKDLAEHLDRPVKMVRWKLDKLGLKARDGRVNGGRQRWVWTPERLDLLRELVPMMSAAEVAQQIGDGLTERQVRTALAYHHIVGRGREREQDKSEKAKKTATFARRREDKYPVDGPWICLKCGEDKDLSEYHDAESTRPSRICRHCWRARNLGMLYGMTPEQYDDLLKSQGGRCAICNQSESRRRSDGKPFFLAVDHDHACCPGKKTCGNCVRGLLCWECNNILGKIEAKEGMLEGLAAYIS